MFHGNLHGEQRYARSCTGGWYFTGDVVRRDADGYFWSIGRSDHVIESAGHLAGPVGGTLVRRLLRARELGLPAGDLSTAGSPS